MTLKIGDEVKIAGRNFLGVVTYVDYFDYPGISNKAVILTGSGQCIEKPIIQLEKTGRHFTQIEDVLKQLKGE